MKERKMKVSGLYRSDRERRPVSSIRLTGKWLEELGFVAGEEYVVRKSPGRIELLSCRSLDESESLEN